MSAYAPPAAEVTASRPGSQHLSAARRAISASKHATGWRRQAYLQDAVEELIRFEKAGHLNAENIGDYIDTSVQFSVEADDGELNAAIATAARAAIAD